jgi:uncharacterized glyoxalase superfamily protein PhnB
MHAHEMFPYIAVKNADQAIKFYKAAFGAKEKFRLVEPSGRVGHAELDFGCGVLMLSEEFPDHGIQAPDAKAPRSACIHLHVENCDAVLRRAAEAGGTIVREPKDQFYGERSGAVRDPSGHEWLIGHEIEKVSYQEMQRRYTAMMKG